MIETQQADAVDVGFAHPDHLAARQHQARRRIGRGEELARQGLERQRDRRQAKGARARDRVAQQCPMAEVEAIEGADANHAALRAQAPAFSVAEQEIHGCVDYTGPVNRLSGAGDAGAPRPAAG